MFPRAQASSFLSINAGFQVKVNLLANEGCVKYAQELGVGRRIWEMKRTPLVPPRQGLLNTPRTQCADLPCLGESPWMSGGSGFRGLSCPAVYIHLCVSPFSLSLFFFFCHLACGILVSRPGIQPACLALEAQSLNHWTTRKAPHLHIFLI